MISHLYTLKLVANNTIIFYNNLNKTSFFFSFYYKFNLVWVSVLISSDFSLLPIAVTGIEPWSFTYSYKNTGQLPGANPLGNRKKPWETHCCQGICQGARAGNTPRRKYFARGYTPVKFPRGTPLSNLPGTYPCETNWQACHSWHVLRWVRRFQSLLCQGFCPWETSIHFFLII
jgi:hypothetical protein